MAACATCGVICDRAWRRENAALLTFPTTRSLFPTYPHADQLHHQVALHAAVRRVLESGSLILGAEMSAFESEFAAFLGVNHVVGVGSGTDAIELMLRALEIGSGSRVVVPAFAPSAVAAGVQRSGAEVVFADIERDTFTLCPEALDKLLRSPAGRGVKAALAVHLFGHPADWLNLQRVADEHGIPLLEDCAQAHGAGWHGRMTGTLGKMAAFSFYPTKNLAACGDAGAVATDDARLAERLGLIRQYGWQERNVSAIQGVNSRLDELQAALLRVKLGTLRDQVNQRRRLAAKQHDVALFHLAAAGMRFISMSCAASAGTPCFGVWKKRTSQWQFIIPCRCTSSLLSRLKLPARRLKPPPAPSFPCPCTLT